VPLGGGGAGGRPLMLWAWQADGGRHQSGLRSRLLADDRLKKALSGAKRLRRVSSFFLQSL